MLQVPSIMSLHLRYRLWIAEMNLDINVLRIFEDYLAEYESKNDELQVRTKIDYFKNEFISLRKEIDDLRHEMHLIKMKLAAFARENKPSNIETYKADNHSSLEKQYLAFRTKYDQIKDEFKNFEGKWLN